jgi:hypothetical protein
MMRAMAETYQNNEQEPTLAEEEYKLLDKRRKAHFEYRSKSYNWEQVKQQARNAVK